MLLALEQKIEGKVVQQMLLVILLDKNQKDLLGGKVEVVVHHLEKGTLCLSKNIFAMISGADEI